MKHKLTVLACVGMALLLSTGFAFAQNSITVESKAVNRCALVSVGIDLTNAVGVEAIGLPLIISGPGSITAAAPTARLAGHTNVQNPQPPRLLLNSVGGCVAAGSGNIWTLTVDTDEICSGTIVIDTAYFPPVSSTPFIVSDCNCCPIPVTFNKGTLTLLNRPPVCGSNPKIAQHHWQSPPISVQLNASDPDTCDELTFAEVAPLGGWSISPSGLLTWDPACADVDTHTVTFSATDNCGASVTCTKVIEVIQSGPACSNGGANSVHWASTLNVPLTASDDGCPSALSWTKISVVPPMAGTVTITGLGPNGNLFVDPTCSDIIGSPHTITWEVSDGVFTAQCNATVTVTNDAPTVICPAPDDDPVLCDGVLIDDDGIFNVGDLVDGNAIGNDVNGDPFCFDVISIENLDDAGAVPVNDPAIDCAGNFSWQTSALDEIGTWEICIEISDGCYADTCCFQVELESKFYLSIKDENGVVDTIPSLPGETKCVYINISPDIPLGGLDLLLCYDLSTLSFMGPAEPVNDLDLWEYFTYRTSANSNCTGGCPSGLIRIVAIADLDNGPAIHPPNSAFGLEGNIVKVCFLVTSDWNYIGQCLPINFCVLDCGDNTLASKDGNTTYLPFGSDPDCLVGGGPGKPLPVEKIELCGGAICVREPQDDRGDINLNGVANEIADAVLFSRYFTEGPDVWTPGLEAVQTQATDVNNDGVALTVADLVYLIRIITGDESPFPSDEGNPKVSPYAGQADAIVRVGTDRVTITTNSAVDLGGAVLVFRYSNLGVGNAALSEAGSQMFVNSRADRGELRVLVAPKMQVKGARIEAGTRELVTIPISGEGTIELVSVELSDASGAMLTGAVAKATPPTSYALMQNYPNPFNAGTIIRFDLKEASDWTLTVYNITGQVVRTFNGHDEASSVSVAWDGRTAEGSETASGVYFYRVNAGSFTATKKMTLLK